MTRALGSCVPDAERELAREIEEVAQVERLSEGGAAARGDELVSAFAAIARGDDRTLTKMRLHGGGDLEQLVAAHLGHAQVDDQTIEVLAMQ